MPKNTETILGIDPGSRFMGYALIEKQGNALRYVDAGRLTLGSAPLEKRLLAIDSFLTQYLQEHTADSLAIEGIFHHKSADSALKLGHARGVALVASVRAGLAFYEYAPTLVKQSVAGYGRADKQQVAHMVSIILGIRHALPEDATDALAIAICHANRSRITVPA